MLKELYDERLAPEDFDTLLETPVDQLDILRVRQLLIRRSQVQRDKTDIEQTLKAVADAYKARIDACDAETARIDERLLSYVKIHGKAAFPDVATAYTQDVKPKIDVADADKAKAWALANGFKKQPEADLTAAKNSFAVGEVPPPESGFVIVPGDKALRVRSNG